MTRTIGIGIIGAGVISAIYLKNISSGTWPQMRAVAVADLVAERAETRAAEFGVLALTIDELLAHPDIDIVINLTIPAAHATVSRQVIAAGKSV